MICMARHGRKIALHSRLASKLSGTTVNALQKLVVIATLPFLLANCASIISGDTQIISISTPNCPGAACELSNNDGTFFVNPTPGTVTVNKSGSDMSITCRKGEHAQTISTESSTDGMTFGNILFGGIIGVAVDAGTGAMYKYDAAITHPLSCPSEVVSPAPDNTKFSLESAKETCLELGFQKGTEKYADCVVRLATQ